MTDHLLDTSAVLTHFLAEPNWELVKDVLVAGRARIATPTRLEFLVRLQSLGYTTEDAEAAFWAYREMAGDLVPVDEEAVRLAWSLRQAANGRLPAIDALIAGCAARIGAVLMHRDPHMASIPGSALPQCVLQTEPLI